MAFKFYFRENGGRAVGDFGKSFYLFAAPLDDFLSVALKKYLAYELGFEGFSIGEMPG